MLSLRKLIASLSILALVALGATISVRYFKGAEAGDWRLRSLINGEATAAFADAFNRAVPFRDFAIDFWGSVSYKLFHEGRKGVLIGAEHWLFSTEEFQTFAHGAAETERKLQYVAKVHAALRAHGSELIVALLPAKARIYPEYLGRYQLPQIVQDQYDYALGRLRALGIHTPDLRAALAAAKSNGPVFLKTDTHWTTQGAAAVARELAAALKTFDLPVTAFTRHELSPVAHRGDLLRYLRVNGFVYAAESTPDVLTPFEARQAEGGVDLFAGEAIPITLVGTSYSANALWSFEAALKLEANADVVNVAKEGFGPIEPMSEYLRSQTFADAAPRIVVWEIPERYLAKPYPDSAFQFEAAPNNGRLSAR